MYMSSFWGCFLATIYIFYKSISNALVISGKMKIYFQLR